MIQVGEDHKRLIDNILQHYPNIFYVFGSRAKGTAREFSDLDLAFTEPLTARQYSVLVTALNESVPYTVGLVDLNKIDAQFRTLIEQSMIPWQA